jgi:predicted AlkP superfamily phosphohydrolase/phosphomutase
VSVDPAASGPRPPLVIIGLDGGSPALLEQLIARGELPTLARLWREGAKSVLLSTLPPATFPAWTSFLTGLEPALHGVTDLVVPESDYTLAPSGGRHRLRPTFVEELSRQGQAVASLGVPATYPPMQTTGITIAGFDGPGQSHATRGAVWPPSYRRTLRRLGGWRYAVFNEQRHHPDAKRVAHALLADLDAKERIAQSVLAERDWDLFFLHLQAADTACHHFWPGFDQRSPRGATAGSFDVVSAVYSRIDALLGRLLAACDGARVLIVSDHGMGGASAQAVHLNRFLAARGLLHFRSSGASTRLAGRALWTLASLLPPELLDAGLRLCPPLLGRRLLALGRQQAVDFAASRAFSYELDYAPAIWLNRRSAFARGRLSDEEAEALARELRDQLLELRDDAGRRLIEAVHLRRQGVEPRPRAIADLMIVPAWIDGYRPSFLVSRGDGPVLRRLREEELAAGRGAGMPGVHQREGLFLLWGAGIPATELPALTLPQAGRFVYRLAGGRAPEACLELPAFLDTLLPAAAAAEAGASASVGPTEPSAFTEAEQGQVRRRLRALGYID